MVELYNVGCSIWDHNIIYFYDLFYHRYPNELAWQINLTRRFIRRSGTVSNFHKFLIHESEMVCGLSCHLIYCTHHKVTTACYI